MTLIKNYLDAVRLYLPRSADQRDILNELSAHLQIKFDEREEEIGRPLTEDEQAAVLKAYGNPLTVAGRYGSTNMGLSFGRQLIGAEIFHLYRMVLLTQFTLTVIVVTVINYFSPEAEARYLNTMAIQFVMTTVIFSAIDVFKRRSASNELWNFPPAYMQAVPRWQSISGFTVLSLVAVWWAAIPFAPFLLLGSAANRVALTSNWHAFYWVGLTPLLIGAAQRLVTFIDPRRAGLQAVTRLITNSWGIVMVLFFLQSAPYVVAADPKAGVIAERINSALWWNATATFGIYWLINGAFMAYLCAKLATRLMRKRREQVMLHQAQS